MNAAKMVMKAPTGAVSPSMSSAYRRITAFAASPVANARGRNIASFATALTR